jgi:quercetin dioxygenase-like cupin family protein
MLMKMRKSTGRLHVHTADYELVVIEGTMKHWRADEDEATIKPMSVGSYWFQPGGAPHADSCLTDTCVMYITWSGPRDARLAENRP